MVELRESREASRSLWPLSSFILVRVRVQQFLDLDKDAVEHRLDRFISGVIGFPRNVACEAFQINEGDFHTPRGGRIPDRLLDFLPGCTPCR